MIYYITKAGESKLSELAEILNAEIIDYKDLVDVLKLGVQPFPDSGEFGGDLMNVIRISKERDFDGTIVNLVRVLNILTNDDKFYILRNSKVDARVDCLLSKQKRCLVTHYQLSRNFSSLLPNIVINDILEFGERMNENKLEVTDVMKNDLRNLLIYWYEPSCLSTSLMNVVSTYYVDKNVIPTRGMHTNKKSTHHINYIVWYMNNTYRTNLLEARGSENVFKEIDPDEIEVSSITDDLIRTEKKLEGRPFFERYRCLCGHLKGKCREGEICNRCRSAVRYNDDLPIEYNNNAIPTSSESNTVLEQLKCLKKRAVSNIYVEQTSNVKYYINDDGYCVALKDFGNVKAGDIGGKVRSYENLSQQGLCWVYPQSVVAGKAVVSGNARVIRSEIYGLAKITGNTTLFGSKVCGCTRIIGSSVISNSYLSIPTKQPLRDVVIADSSMRTSVPANAIILNRNEIK